MAENSANAWFANLVGPIVDQIAITNMREALIKAVTAWALTMVEGIDKFKFMRALFSIDAESKKYTNVMVFNHKLDPLSKGQITQSHLILIITDYDN